jgi:alpha-galactosidase
VQQFTQIQTRAHFSHLNPPPASGVTCGGDPGQTYFEDIDAQTYVKWGVDFLKSDNCASYALDSSVRFGAMRDALNRTEAKVLLSIEPFSINPDPEVSVKVSNSWRIGTDIRGNWATFMDRADKSDKWSPLAGPGNHQMLYNIVLMFHLLQVGGTTQI